MRQLEFHGIFQHTSVLTGCVLLSCALPSQEKFDYAVALEQCKWHVHWGSTHNASTWDLAEHTCALPANNAHHLGLGTISLNTFAS